MRLSLKTPVLLAAVVAACLPLAACRAAHQTPSVPAAPPLYSDSERAEIAAYWNAPGRYQIAAPDDVAKSGVWQVRLTPEGSTWLLAYQRAVSGARKLPPTQDARAFASSANPDWEPWVTAKVAYDRFQAQQAADTANAAIGVTAKKAKDAPTTPPIFPGPVPTTLLTACGNPPVFATAVTPLAYRITFDDGDTYTYTDNVKMRDRYAYYRFARGVNTNGTSVKDLPAGECSSLFQAAGFTPGEQHIFEAISKLEGGFDSVQSYDTGYISVGFIQFVTLAEGRHDLSSVLLQEKVDRPDDYTRDFRRFGIDVRDTDHSMVVVDPATGAELSGTDAVMKVIDDKRLLAVFQRAGRKTPFRVAQIKVAKSFYWPTDDAINVRLADGTVLTGKVGDIIRSEAGLATLLDRKINTGNWRPLEEVVARVMASHKCPCKTVTEACDYEREIVTALKYRTDFLSDPTLAKP